MISHNHGDSPLRPYPSGPITVTLTLAPSRSLYDLQAISEHSARERAAHWRISAVATPATSIRPWKDGPVPRLPSVFRRLLKEAASAHLEQGWTLRGAGLVLHAPDGCWGQIVFSGASRERAGPRAWTVPEHKDVVAEWPILEMGLTAGTCAPYLMRIVNKLDPSKPPPPNFVAAHTQVCWHAPVWLAQAARVSPPPFEIPEGILKGNEYCIDVGHGGDLASRCTRQARSSHRSALLQSSDLRVVEHAARLFPASIRLLASAPSRTRQ